MQVYRIVMLNNNVYKKRSRFKNRHTENNEHDISFHDVLMQTKKDNAYIMKVKKKITIYRRKGL